MYARKMSTSLELNFPPVDFFKYELFFVKGQLNPTITIRRNTTNEPS